MTTLDIAFPASPSDALQQILEETRQRFATTFIGQCDSIRILVDKVATLGVTGPVAALAQVIHRLSGLAGTIGFPTISARASELEDLVDGASNGTFDVVRARQSVDAVQAAFAHDVAMGTVWAPAAVATVRGARILMAEDDADQRAIMTTCLESAGYMPVSVGSGDMVMDAVRSERPALILLDVEMPGMDGYAVCRQLKADAETAGIPVMFMTTRATLDDKLAALTLGADEFLNKPVDLREVILRIQLLLKRTGSSDSVDAPVVTAASGLAGRRQGARAGTVVIAEDDPDVMRIVDAQVRAAGYTAITAVNGEEALAAVGAHAPEVLVLDLMMPKVNGFDVLTRLRQRPGTAPRIMVLSGRGREQDVVRAFDLGADDYMTKPFNPQEMMARIDRLLKKPLTRSADMQVDASVLQGLRLPVVSSVLSAAA